MSAVWAHTRADLRARGRAWLGLTLLVAVTGAVVLTAAAAARRTATAFPRLLAAGHAPDVLISPQDTGLAGFDADVGRLPEVDALGEMAGVPLARVDASGQIDPLVASPPASVDGKAGYTVYRPKILSGRMPRRDRESEILATRSTARHLHLRVGSHLTLVELTPDENGGRAFDPGLPRRRFTFTVTGIGVLVDTVANSEPGVTDNLLLTPAWYRAHGDPANLSFTGAFLRLHRGTDMARLREEIDQLAARHPETGSSVYFSSLADRYTAERRAIRPQTIALGLFAALAGAAALLVVGQALARHVLVATTEHSTLRALGMTPAQLFAASAIPAAGVAVTGALLASLTAALASPIGPIGVARLAEPHPGFALNLALLGSGAAAVALLLCAWIAVPAWRAASAADMVRRPSAGDTIRPSAAAAAATRTGFPPTVATGLRMAFEPGRGRTAVPVRSAVVGGAVAVAALMAAASFVSDLGHLVSTPRLYGTTWDFAVDAQFSSFPGDQGAALLSSVRGVGSFAGGVYGNVTIAGRAVSAVGIDRMRGQVFPTLLQGRPPTTPDEIVLGTNTLRQVHRSVGQTVDVQLPGGTRSMRIVGRTVFPGLGRGGFPPTDLGEGAATVASVLTGADVPEGSYNFFLARLARGADAKAVLAEVGQAATAGGCPTGQCPSLTPRPADIDNYARVRSTPLVLAGTLALLAAASIGHALVTSVRRRRRDLAILKTLGFVRRQVSAAVAWQATALVGLALIVGIPLGLAFGRWGWALFAHQLGIGDQSVLPLRAIPVLVLVALALSNLMAALPARLAARTRPAVVLRAE